MASKGSYCTGKDVLLLPDGSVYHLGIKKGEVHDRIITVGAHSRADALSLLLDKNPAPISKTSDRLFRVISGFYKGKGITIIAIGMGAPLADFLMREVTYVHPGPMAVVRIGTCGLFDPSLAPGTIVVADKGSSYIYRNYAYFDGCFNDESQNGRKSGVKPYLITKPVLGDAGLSSRILSNLKQSGQNVVGGLNVAGETFYSCQGRVDPHFEDENSEILKDLEKMGATSVEMETHQVFHLAKLRKTKCFAAGCAVGIVNRRAENLPNITPEQLAESQNLAGIAVMEALIATDLS